MLSNSEEANKLAPCIPSRPVLEPTYKTELPIEDISIRQKIHGNASYDGKLLWRIDNISSRMIIAEKGEVAALDNAPPYTNRYGYKFCDRLYLNGDGIGRKDYFIILCNYEIPINS